MKMLFVCINNLVCILVSESVYHHQFHFTIHQEQLVYVLLDNAGNAKPTPAKQLIMISYSLGENSIKFSVEITFIINFTY